MCALAFSGSSTGIAVSSGCTQGGVLSSFLGFLVLDDSIARLTGGDTYTRVTLMTFVF
jgi:aconitase B